MPPYLFWGLSLVCLTATLMLVAAAIGAAWARRRFQRWWAAPLGMLGGILCVSLACGGGVVGVWQVIRCDSPSFPVTDAELLGTWTSNGADPERLVFQSGSGSSGRTFEITNLNLSSDRSMRYTLSGTWSLRQIQGQTTLDVGGVSLTPDSGEIRFHSLNLCGSQPPYEMRLIVFECSGRSCYDPDVWSEDWISFKKR